MIREREKRNPDKYRLDTIVRNLLETKEDEVHYEFWSHVARSTLNMERKEGVHLDPQPFDYENDNCYESDWVVELEEGVYGAHIIFLRLSNRAASLLVDQTHWVKTPIFLKANKNKGIFLNVDRVPKEMFTKLKIVGTKYYLK